MCILVNIPIVNREFPFFEYLHDFCIAQSFYTFYCCLKTISMNNGLEKRRENHWTTYAPLKAIAEKIAEKINIQH